MHKYSFLKLQNNEKNKIDPTLMPLHRKRKKEKETKWGGVGDFQKNIYKNAKNQVISCNLQVFRPLLQNTYIK